MPEGQFFISSKDVYSIYHWQKSGEQYVHNPGAYHVPNFLDCDVHWNLPWAALKYQDATGLAAGTGRLTMGVEIVPSPNEADTWTELLGLRIVLDIREIGPYLLTIGGSNGMNSSSAMIESDLRKHKLNTN